MKVAQLCLTLCAPVDDIVHGILQAKILEWVAIPYSRGSSQPRDWTQVSHIAGKTYFLGNYKFYQGVWSLFSVCLCEEKFLKYWMPGNIFNMTSYMNDSLARNYILNSKFLFFNTRCYFIISLHQCYCWKIKSYMICIFPLEVLEILLWISLWYIQISSPPLISPLQLEVFHLFFSNSEKCTFTVVVQSLSHVHLFATPWTAARQASLSFTSSQSLLKLMSTESVLPSNHFILCHPFSSCPQSLPVLEYFPLSWLITSGGQSNEASASASVLPMNKCWFSLRLTVWSSCSPNDSQESSPTPQHQVRLVL